MLDKKDSIILEVLKQNAKLSTQQISRETGIPITTVHNRIKKLENKGVIKGYTVRLDYDKVGKKLAAYILVTVDYKLLKQKGMSQHDLAKKLKKHTDIEEIAMITGGNDIIIKIRVSDIAKLDEFVTRYLRNVDGVEKTQTMVILNEV